MDWKDAWRLKSRLTLVEAALLICGENPSRREAALPLKAEPESFRPVLDSMIEYFDKLDWFETRAIGGDLKASSTINPSEYQVSNERLGHWMAEKGIKSEVILSPDASSQPQMDILDKGSPFYTVKLAAAVTVWTALKRDPSLLRVISKPMTFSLSCVHLQRPHTKRANQPGKTEVSTGLRFARGR